MSLFHLFPLRIGFLYCTLFVVFSGIRKAGMTYRALHALYLSDMCIFYRCLHQVRSLDWLKPCVEFLILIFLTVLKNDSETME